MERMSPPAVPEQPVPVLGEDALVKLLATCKGGTFENRPDAAIIRLFVDPGMRAGELIGLRLEDIDFEVSLVRRGQRGSRPHLPVRRSYRRCVAPVSPGKTSN